MISTRLTQVLGIDYPVASAPMSMHSSGVLAAAVSRAGGLGMFGGTHPAGGEWIREQTSYVRSQTDRPYGVGFVSHFMKFFEGNLEAAIDERVPVIAFSFGEGDEWIARAKKGGAKVMVQVQAPDQAAQALAAGADILVAQGNEAGGHTGTMGLLPLLTLLIERHPEAPILAAGGIATGRALAAVLAAGADGAWVGTAFLATPESTEVSDHYKQIIVEGSAQQTTYSTVFDIIETRFLGVPDWPEGIGARLYRNETVREWEGREGELLQHIQEVLPRYGEARQRRDPEQTAVYMGQSASFVNAIRPAAEVLHTICDYAERLLRDRPQDLLRA